MLIITNNSNVSLWFDRQKDRNCLQIKYFDCEYIDIFYRVRDYLHEGYLLLSHPLAGSLKPNQTPYRSIAIEKGDGSMDFNGLAIMEHCMETAEKFLNIKSRPDWPERTLEDFRTVDCSFLEHVVERHINVKL